MKNDELKELAIAGVRAEIQRLNGVLVKLAGTSAQALSNELHYGPRRKLKKMTAARRKAVSVRMKAYWAARRKSN